MAIDTLLPRSVERELTLITELGGQLASGSSPPAPPLASWTWPPEAQPPG